MVVACAAAIWLIGQPQDFTGAGKAVSDGITQALNVAFSKLPAPHESNCVPVGKNDPQSPAEANFNYTSGNGVVDSDANELWSVLVCKPWLIGEFGSAGYTVGKGAPTVVNKYGRQLLWAQAIAVNEKPTANVIQAKQDAYTGIASSLQKNDPATYALFQGKQWTTRLEIAFAALFAALLAGVLVLLIAITLILLKLGFLLLLIAGPFFLIVGIHPGFGRVIALRWGELLIGVLLKQAAIAVVLSVLLYAYSLIMGTSDSVLPWGLKILMISLVTVAVFIYRKPFTHLFAAVGYGVIGSREADTQLARAGSTAGRNTVDAATVAVPGFAAYRAARWARRNPGQAASVAAQVATAGATAGTAGALAGAAASGGSAGPGQAAAEAGAAEAGPGGAPDHTVGAGAAAMGRARAGANGTPARTPPPLDLPSRSEEGAARPPSGWARSGANGSLGVPPQSRPRAPGPAGQPAGGGQQARASAPGLFGGHSGGGHSGGGHSGGGHSGGGAGRTPPAIPARTAPAPPPRSAPPPRAAPRAAPPARRTAPPAAPRSAPQAPTAAPGTGAGNGSRGSEPPPSGPFWLRPLRRRK
jgi:uncharacterized membrane protein YgcG